LFIVFIDGVMADIVPSCMCSSG